MARNDALEDYTKRFFGYGSWKAPIWFVGMEEGGANACYVKNFDKHLRSWAEGGRRALVNIRTGAPLQKTWLGLIRVQLGREGVRHGRRSLELARDYQRVSLCRTSKECLIELLPLPSRSIGKWPWAERYPQVSWLRNRTVYRKHVLGPRCERICRAIHKHRPRAVVFYGLTYQDEWSRISGARFAETAIPQVSFAHDSNTLFAVMPHPNMHGLKAEYFLKVGAAIGRKLA